MEKIRRGHRKRRSGLFLKTMLITALCIAVLVLGYISAGVLFGR